jgi:hypothetical protein
MVKKRKTRRQKANHAHVVVLDWIETTPDGMRCTRCNSFAPVEASGQYKDDIPHIRLPHEWFTIHSVKDHSPAIPNVGSGTVTTENDPPKQGGLF